MMYYYLCHLIKTPRFFGFVMDYYMCLHDYDYVMDLLFYGDIT